MSRWTWILIVLGALGQAGIVRAQAAARATGTLDEMLKVEPSADGCITRASLQARVERWLGATPIRPGLSVTVHGAAEPMAFSVQHDGTGFAERSFDVLPQKCVDRVDAVAITVAIAITHAEQARAEAEATVAAAPTEPSTVAPVASAATAPPSPPPNPTPAKATSPAAAKPEASTSPDDAATTAAEHSAPSIRIHAGAAFLAEVLPGTALGFGLGADLPLSRALSVVLTGLVVPETAQTLATGSVLMQLYGGRALMCLGAPASGLVLEGCVGAAGGAMSGRGSGYATNETATMAWVAGAVRGAARFPARGLFGVRLAVDGLVNAVRPSPQLVLDDAPEQASAFPAGFAGSLELLFALP